MLDAPLSIAECPPRKPTHFTVTETITNAGFHKRQLATQAGLAGDIATTTFSHARFIRSLRC
ncbi:MAG: hypothetical protein CMM02_03515 [Rhodopirellula sp.]|nr:hypothetical protein [Rhodopirellula sp.]